MRGDIVKRQFAYVVLALVLFACVAFGADPPKIVGETRVAPYKLVRLKVEGLDKGMVPLWKVRPIGGDRPVDWATKSHQVLSPEWVAPPGEYLVEATWGKTGEGGALVLDYAEVRVFILQPGPPGPGPGPTPPGPDPGPTPPQPVAPIQKPGLRVLIVRESDANAMNALTVGQREVILGKKVRDYLSAKCVSETPANPNGAWRILDPQTQPTTNGDPDGQTWAAALGRPRAALPWVLVSNGTRNIGFEGALPADITGDKFIEFVKGYE